MDLPQFVADHVVPQGAELVGAHHVPVGGAALLADPVAGQAHLHRQHLPGVRAPSSRPRHSPVSRTTPWIAAFECDRTQMQFPAFEGTKR